MPTPRAGTSNEPCAGTFEEAKRDLEGRDLSRLNQVDIANIAWAFASARHEAPELFRRLAQEAMRPTDPVGGRMSRLGAGMQSPRERDLAQESEGEMRLSEFHSLTMSNLALSFSRAGYLDRDLLREVRREILERRLKRCVV